MRAARRRTFFQSLLNRLVVCWSAALVVGLGWVIAHPLVVDDAPPQLQWYVVGGAVVLGGAIAVWWARRATPPAPMIALEVDTRFGLKERVTTALGLTAAERATPAGQAVVADAVAKVTPLVVKDRFPVRPKWPALFVPTLAACVVLAALFPLPIIKQLRADEDANSPEKKGTAADQQKSMPPNNPTPFTKKNRPPELAARTDKSKELKELEEQLNEMMRKFDTDPNRDTPEKLKDKVAELTSAEEKVRKFNEEKKERLEKMAQQLEQLDRLKDDKDFKDGPAKGLKDALAKGDTKKAIEELDQLKKKMKDKNLSQEEKEQLSRQMDKMKQQLADQSKNKEREKQLEKLIDKAKKEGKDAEALERELNQMKQESKDAAEAAQNLAERMQKTKDALDKGDLEEAAKELEKAMKSLEQTEGELQDLADAQDFLQRLKDEKKNACKQCQGNKNGDEIGNKDDADWSPFTNPATGRRKENRDAQSSSQDERIRGIFDPKGRKTYGGATRGPAFKSSSSAELGPAIEAAAQDAPKSIDSQRLPRDAKDAVKDYFQNLGGQAPGGK
ncbi:massive surface protein MspF [Fimbriiglobus ruber]|uniref:Massive surface protein MspF n=1 Tax=Fimbriiglobus ruber TaxID=1908690 RepID=A0A225E538_9BACT|nr:massive surface protein MspF [Fimbriiglobus ruber]